MTHTRTPLRLALALGLLLVGGAQAGSLTPPAAPDNPGSAMFTLEDLYQRLDSGAPGALRTGPFVAPTAGPGSTGHTLNEAMGKAPAVDDTAGAAPADVPIGKTFWGLKGSAWGTRTGTMSTIGAQTITPGVAAQTISQGYHDGTGSVAGDADLSAGNIRSGVNLFGIDGSVLQATGAATAGQVLTGVIFSNASGAATGTMPNIGVQNLTPGAAAQAISVGYHNGSGSVAGDADLTAGNIRSGVTLFGVGGSVVQAAGAATAAQVLNGVSFSNASGAGTGTMPNIGAQNITPGAAAQAISAGYHNGSGSVAGDANLAAGNIRQGVSIFGVSGGVYGGCNCASGTLRRGRWCDNGNGTVTDLLGDTTNRNVGRCLVWMKNANCSANLATINKTGPLTWENAQVWSSAVVSGVCGLTDGSTAYEWRLPTRAELDGPTNGTAPVLLASPAPFSGVQASYYWSATTDADDTSWAWLVNLYGGLELAGGKTFSGYVWPVRGGQ
ncbi:DUF1566 domain-containing protein [uncultured Thiodictyon sp.]|jgi:hypothetical protein|uniref:Lcl C-terminal domain-containing protein n=1 Tax=uncultured Thiodictyon sp. TaxID=1846217 RepID=UPI0025D19A72|nr:DUF1566 domain-containing protein [uncultured Thiodictyon sp.]